MVSSFTQRRGSTARLPMLLTLIRDLLFFHLMKLVASKCELIFSKERVLKSGFTVVSEKADNIIAQGLISTKIDQRQCMIFPFNLYLIRSCRPGFHDL